MRSSKLSLLSSPQVIRGSFKGYLHLVLQLLLEDAVELLHIVLHKGVIGVPAKGLCQVGGGDAGLPKLQLQDSIALSRQ